MNKKLLAVTLIALCSSLFTPISAQTGALIKSSTPDEKIGVEEFQSDEVTQEGILTHYVNKAIEKQMDPLKSPLKGDEPQKEKKVVFGRHITDWVSAPKFGGYFIGRYQYTSQDGQNTGNGFTQRLTRFYIDGNILKYFHYRIQLQASNDKFHMKDYFVEWKRYDFFSFKIGQFKRAFGLENPMNPWDVGMGDYSQMTKLFTGHDDQMVGENSSNGGRDQGLQFQGDVIRVGKDRHHLLHYQVMVSNGQGINANDLNSQKDVSGSIQFQPIKGLKFGFMGWTGRFQSTAKTKQEVELLREDLLDPEKITGTKINTVTVTPSERLKRDRWEVFASYDKNDWTARFEYARHNGYTPHAGNNDGVADAWYMTLGVPFTPWLKCYLKWDVYRADATWNTEKTMYSICPNIQIHKDLMLQLQYNYVHDLTVDDHNYHQFWLETYVRF